MTAEKNDTDGARLSFQHLNEMLLSRAAIHGNTAAIRSRLPSGCRLAAVLKGDAYGHGLSSVAAELETDDNVSLFALASLDEALSIRHQGIRKPLLILCQTLPEQIREALEQGEDLHDLIFSAYTAEEVRLFGACGVLSDTQIEVHLRRDLFGGLRGMDRETFTSCRDAMFRMPGVRITGLYGHVFSAYGEDDARTERDLEAYAELFRSLPPELRRSLTCHLLTSVSFFRFPAYCFDMVRVGAALYGLPIPDPAGELPRLEGVATVRSAVLNVVPVTGESELDYEGKLSESVRHAALLSLGVWDAPGFFRGRTTRVSVRGRLLHVVGSPCMDTC